MKVALVCTYRADVTADEFVAIVTAHQNAKSIRYSGAEILSRTTKALGPLVGTPEDRRLT